jgi:cob(I)alamin adenosyltransferase
LGQAIEMLSLGVEELSASLGPLADFILPGGSERGAWAHVCRSVCRRAERSVAALDEGASPESKALLNRLSDWLFCVARELNRQDGVAEELWRDARKGA